MIRCIRVQSNLLTLLLVALLLSLLPPAPPVRAQALPTPTPAANAPAAAPAPALLSATAADSAIPTAWFDLILELIRQTPGFTPPVASRVLGYSGVTLYESVAPGVPGARSLAGQLNGLAPLPAPQADAVYSWPLVASTAMAGITRRLFASAGMAQRASIDGLETNIRKRFVGSAPPDVIRRSIRYGRLVAAAIYAWSRTDGGQDGEYFNTPTDYIPPQGAGLWVATPPGYLKAMQPYWGENRPLLLPSGADCAPPPPPAFSTEPDSPMYLDALEVYTTVHNLTPEQRQIALFWADDPNLTATPPGHSLAIGTQVLRDTNASLAQAAEVYARLGIAVADAFIACWKIKYTYNRIRPITYIQEYIDPNWNSPTTTDPVITPPFPEYPSGHSSEIGAAATVLSAIYGENYAFTDRTQQRLGFAPRSFPSFDAAAEEAAMSRLYGGLHYRSGNEAGLAQGRCVGRRVMGLQMLAGNN